MLLVLKRPQGLFAKGIDDLWQIDLVDVSVLAAHNDGYKYILTVIDVFSKFSWALPLKNKTGTTLTKAFSTILQSVKPTFVQSDKGTEFLNSMFQKLLANNAIKFYTSQN